MDFPLYQFLAWYKENEKGLLENFFEFLSIPSESADPNRHKECRRAAKFLANYLEDLEMEVELLESAVLPAVFAKTKHKDPVAKTVLFYHHYDVQPEDPIELWHTPPFEPEMREGKVFARGASDNKGQCFITLAALKGLKSLMDINARNIKIFIEGEEESGGTGTEEILRREQKKLQADALCVIDFDLWSAEVPSIALGYRGILAMEVRCINSKTDLHSGVHGGVARNPLQLLTSALAKMYDEKGKIQLPGFFEGVEGFGPIEEMDLSFVLEEYQKEFGVKALYEEPEKGGRIWPTIEINGISGGYAGEGFKTVIPSSATAKISCRLVPGQDPQIIAQKVQEFLRKQIPEEVKLEWRVYGGAPALYTSKTGWIVQKVADSLESTFGNSCRYCVCGGSVPIVSQLAKLAKGEVALFGFALASDNIHAPNEHFRIDLFRKGVLSMAQLIWSLG